MSSFTDLAPGAWTVDPAHSEIGFVARHLMVTKVRGRFSEFEATVTVGDSFETSSATATIQLASVDTRTADRDNHLRSSEFFDVAVTPTMTFSSTKVSADSIAGDLTIKGVTQPIVLDLEFNGVTTDPWGGTRAGFEAHTEINRKDFGLTWNVALESGGVVVGDKIKIELDIELVKAA